MLNSSKSSHLTRQHKPQLCTFIHGWWWKYEEKLSPSMDFEFEWWVFPLCKSTHIDQLDSENVVVMAQLNLCFIGMTIFSLSNSSMAKEGSNVKKQSTETESNDNV